MTDEARTSQVDLIDSDYVTWPQLLEWAKAHGAVNDSITSISLGTKTSCGHGAPVRVTVTITGNAYDENGRPYTVSDGDGLNRLAKWVVTDQVVRWLP